MFVSMLNRKCRCVAQITRSERINNKPIVKTLFLQQRPSVCSSASSTRHRRATYSANIRLMSATGAVWSNFMQSHPGSRFVSFAHTSCRDQIIEIIERELQLVPIRLYCSSAHFFNAFINYLGSGCVHATVVLPKLIPLIFL